MKYISKFKLFENKKNDILEELNSISYIMEDDEIGSLNGYYSSVKKIEDEVDIPFISFQHTDIEIRFTRRESEKIEKSGNLKKLTDSDKYQEYIDRLEEICEKFKYNIKYLTPVWIILSKKRKPLF